MRHSLGISDVNIALVAAASGALVAARQTSRGLANIGIVQSSTLQPPPLPPHGAPISPYVANCFPQSCHYFCLQLDSSLTNMPCSVIVCGNCFWVFFCYKSANFSADQGFSRDWCLDNQAQSCTMRIAHFRPTSRIALLYNASAGNYLHFSSTLICILFAYVLVLLSIACALFAVPSFCDVSFKVLDNNEEVSV